MIRRTKTREAGGALRLREAFEKARRQGRAAFIPFLVAGDPDLPRSIERYFALVEAGADFLEVGIPFSDPIADGPVIQAATERALEAGTNVEEVLASIAEIRRRGVETPIVLFSYFNPILRYGVSRFADHAQASGADGVLVVDLPPEEAGGGYLETLERTDLAPIFLLAPTSSKARIDLVHRVAQGFVYYVSRTGTTGERKDLRDALAREVRTVAGRVRLPVAVGFGISSPEQVHLAASVADGVVVGSALVRAAHQGGLAAMTELAIALREGTRR